MFQTRICQLVGCLAVALASAAATAGDRGYFGFAISVDAEGFFLNPTLNAVRIEKVTPDSPASKAGLDAGDLIVEIEGKTVAGAKAKDLQPFLEREVGQTTRLVVKKPSGLTLPVSLVAGPKIPTR